MVRAPGIAAWGLACALAFPAAAAAQIADARPPVPMTIDAPSDEVGLPVMTLDPDELYMRSAWGQRVQADIDSQGREIETENDRLASQFSAEEQELTTLRQSLPPDEFRKRADEFDKRVVEVRRERDTARRDLAARAEEERNAFFRAALPVLAGLMHERGAVAVLDQRAIFVASQSIDVTEALIERMDREVGAGPLAETPPADERPAENPAAETP